KCTKKGKIKGKITYTLSSAKKDGKSFKNSFSVNKNSGKLTVKKGLKQGTYKVKVKVKAAGNKNYDKATKTVTVTVKVK
ncbi:MAG: cadherin domain-containing protein, partial [Lachnospiraceae bacterium]|nr:cadherin domain-containing protein [Lachnospiraceae bacterium]